MSVRYRLSGDDGVGQFTPPDVRRAEFARFPDELLRELRAVRGLVSTASDVLDEAGWALAVPAAELAPRHRQRTTVVGHALTLRYLPSRHNVVHPGSDLLPPKLGHHVVIESAERGDVMVVDASATRYISTMGGLAAGSAFRRGLSGVVVDGGVRDLDEIEDSALPLWSRSVTPRCGKGRLEAITVNGPIACGGVQVLPGDLVLADATGLCFVPPEFVPVLSRRVLEVARSERDELQRNGDLAGSGRPRL